MSLRPLAPWQAAHCDAKRCGYGLGAAALAAAARGAAALAGRALLGCCALAAQASSNEASAAVPKARRRSLISHSLAAVADSIDRTGVIIADQQRAVLHHQEVRRAAEVFVVLDEAGHERLDLRAALAVGPRDEHAVVLLRAVPRPMLGDEHRALVLRREHLAGVELQAQRAGVRPQQRGGRGEVLAVLAPAELRIGDVALVAEREAEVLL